MPYILLCTLAVSLLLPLLTFAGEAPPPVVARFHGDAAAAVSFTFDDGSQNQVNIAVPLLNEFGVKATFFLVTGPMREHKADPLPKGASRSGNGGASWEEWREVAKMGHEIGNHSLTHPNLPKTTDDAVLDQEINGSYQLIKEKLGQAPLTFCYPGNGYDTRVRAVVMQKHIAARESCVGYGGPAPGFTLEKANDFIDKAIADRAWIVPMLHGVEEGYSPIDRDTLRKHLEYLKERRAQVWVDTFANVSRYVQERDNAVLTVKDRRADAVTFTLTTSLDPAIFNIPLTVVVPTPGKPVLVEVIPGDKPVTVTWK